MVKGRTPVSRLPTSETVCCGGRERPGPGVPAEAAFYLLELPDGKLGWIPVEVQFDPVVFQK